MITYERKRKLALDFSKIANLPKLDERDELLVDSSLALVIDMVCEEILPQLNRKQLLHFVEKLVATIVTLQACEVVANGGQGTRQLFSTEERIEVNALMLLERAALLVPDLTLKFEENVEKEIRKKENKS